MALTRKDFLEASPLKIEKVDIPPLGEMYLREMGGKERDEFESNLMGADGRANPVGFRARLVMLCVCDENGVRIFSNDDFDAINEKPATLLQEIVDKILDLNGLKAEDIEGN